MANKNPIPQHLRKIGFSANKAIEVSKHAIKHNGKAKNPNIRQIQKHKLAFDIMMAVQSYASRGEFSAFLENSPPRDLQNIFDSFNEDELNKFFPGMRFVRLWETAQAHHTKTLKITWE